MYYTFLDAGDIRAQRLGGRVAHAMPSQWRAMLFHRLLQQLAQYLRVQCIRRNTTSSTTERMDSA